MSLPSKPSKHGKPDKLNKPSKHGKLNKPGKHGKPMKGVKDMKTIVVFNQKGGVGKTSTVINLMSEFTTRGKKVLVVDLDAQRNLTTFCGVREADRSVIDWLTLKGGIDEITQTKKYGDIIPADRTLETELLRFASMPAFVIRIRDLLSKIPQDRYDVVLIDCPPAVNQLTAAALVAADYVLIPTEAEFFSADGVGRIAETIAQVRPLNQEIKVLGVLIVKYNSRRTLTQALEAKLGAAVERLLDCEIFRTKIRATVDVPAAQATGLSVKEYRRDSKAAKDYSALADEIENIIGDRK